MKILIIGAGAYGLALAENLTEKNDVIVYSSRKEEIDALNKDYSNFKLFPDILLSKTIKFTNNLNLNNIDLIILAVPSNYLINVINDLENKVSRKTIICIASKGLVNNEFSFNIVKKHLKVKDICILSGPSFACDLIKKQNVILTVAGSSKLQGIFSDNIKLEFINDLVGIQLCGTLKNIFAIGSGILGGLNISESTKAAYLTKIINETGNIIKSFRGDKNTISKACGIGDIILTCNSKESRNYTFGYLIGINDDYIAYRNTHTVEGVDALISIKNFFSNYNKNFEIIDIIYGIVFDNCDVFKLLNYIIKNQG